MTDPEGADADRSITLTLDGETLSFSRSISLELAVRVMSFVLSPVTPPAEHEANHPGSSRSQTKSNSRDGDDPDTPATPRAALIASGATSNPEKIVVLARYYEVQHDSEGFTVDAVRKLFVAAREAPPANFPRDLTKAIQADWIAQLGGSSNEYFVTGDALDVLSDGVAALRASGTTRSRSSSRPRRAGKAPQKPAIFAGVDDFPDDLEGIPSYHKMKSEKDRLLWVLKLADTLVHQPLSNKDVAWLTNHLGESIPSANVTGAFNQARRLSLVSRSTEDNSIRLKPAGHEYLAGLNEKHG